MKRPFYLIARNPNSVEEAIECLAAGANALEPDVYFIDNDFYVMDLAPLWSKLITTPKRGPRLADYLTELQGLILASKKDECPLRLARILFDIKNLSHFDLNRFFEVVRSNFSLPGVALGVTTRDKKQIGSFNGFVPKDEKESIGLDGYSAKDALDFFKEIRMNYTYACGPKAPAVSAISKDYFIEIMTAIRFRDSASAVKPNQVYAWTVNCKDSMRTYLSLGVDGFTTDKIKDALSVISEPEFEDKFVLA
ncbi:MAG: hypothetical protein JSS79_01200 [Bacteroidetes bacterium]|nr:hypothetical protein [Bacteroidota bacterium]